MFAFFVVIHAILCVTLILVVLLQAGRGGGLAGAFGGSGTAQTLFGGRGAATFLSKTTAWLAVAFMLMSILLAVLSSRGRSGDSLMQRRARAGQGQLPPSTSTLDPAVLGDTSAALFSDEGALEPAVQDTTPGANP